MTNQAKNYQWSVDEKPVKVDKWNCTAVKNALDDAVRKVMTECYPYEEDHTLIDYRLFICTLSCGFAIVALIYDFFHPFPESRSILAICVISYFVMMTVLTLYTSFIECNHFLVVHQKDQAGVDPDNVWTIDSCMKRFDADYTLMVQYQDGKASQKRENSFTKSVGQWFDENGLLLLEDFKNEICALHDSLLTEKKDK